MSADHKFLQLISTHKSLYHSAVNRWSEMTSVGNSRTHNPSVPGSNPGCPIFIICYLIETKHYQQLGPDGIFAVVQKAKSLNIHPMEALNGGLYYVQGRVEMSAQMMNQTHSISLDTQPRKTQNRPKNFAYCMGSEPTTAIHGV